MSTQDQQKNRVQLETEINTLAHKVTQLEAALAETVAGKEAGQTTPEYAETLIQSALDMISP